MINKKTKEIECDICGKLDYVLLDGYAVGDRLLESVMFQISPVKNKFKAKISPCSKDYFENLNKKKWLKEIEDYANDTDVLSCPKCGGDIYYE